jgi:methionyl-tRNA formyltransferase
MKDIRIVFMGTPDFAVSSLKALVEKGYHIVGVVTAPDKPSGRGRKIYESAVKKYASSQGLHILQPTNLKDPDFLQELESMDIDLQVVVAFRMLPVQVWSKPKLGTFNLHASLLPDYRGAAPINWAIINGETQTGVTTFYINENIDTGAILKQVPVPIGSTESAGDLHDKLMITGSQLVLDTVEMIRNGEAKPIKQEAKEYKLAPKLNKDNCRINWDQPLLHVYNHVRGLSPYPGAWTILENGGEQTELKVVRTTMLDEIHQLKPGTIIITKKNIKVAAKNGFLDINELKMAGKRQMDASSLLNGYVFKVGCHMI